MVTNLGGETDVVVLYVPCGSKEEAAAIAHSLLRERLIACANIFRSRSLYMWNGTLSDAEEYLLLCKTMSSRSDAAERRVQELHSYKVPCILQVQPAHVNYAYAAWVAGEVHGSLADLAASQADDTGSSA